MAKKEESTKLVEAAVINVLGTVVGISQRNADVNVGGRFKHDTKIITLADLLSDGTVDVFITANQWKEYNCEQSLWSGNVVNVTMEHNIEGVTGYLETPDSVELKAHEKTFNSFARVNHMDSISLMKTLSRQGVPADVIGLISNSLMQTRVLHEQQVKAATLSPATVSSFNVFNAPVE